MLADVPKRRPSRAARVAELLTARTLTLATAESASAGSVAHRLTAIAGASAYFMGGVVAGDCRAWPALGDPLDAPAGRVAEAIRARLGADIGLCVGPFVCAHRSFALGLAAEKGPAMEVTIRTGAHVGFLVVSNRVLNVLERWLVEQRSL